MMDVYCSQQAKNAAALFARYAVPVSGVLVGSSPGPELGAGSLKSKSSQVSLQGGLTQRDLTTVCATSAFCSTAQTVFYQKFRIHDRIHIGDRNS